jgi:GNAT superfamily N-acetyltransferase
MQPIEFRLAYPHEAPILTEIALAAKRHWGYPEGWISQWAPMLTFSAADLVQAEVITAVVDEEITGFYRLSVQGRRASLDDLWVRPEWMGRGLGRALFQHARANAGAAGASTLEIESDPNARGFYEKMGAHQVREHATELEGLSRILPVLEIACDQLL